MTSSHNSEDIEHLISHRKVIKEFKKDNMFVTMNPDQTKVELILIIKDMTPHENIGACITLWEHNVMTNTNREYPVWMQSQKIYSMIPVHPEAYPTIMRIYKIEQL